MFQSGAILQWSIHTVVQLASVIPGWVPYCTVRAVKNVGKEHRLPVTVPGTALARKIVSSCQNLMALRFNGSLIKWDQLVSNRQYYCPMTLRLLLHSYTPFAFKTYTWGHAPLPLSFFVPRMLTFNSVLQTERRAKTSFVLLGQRRKKRLRNH